MTLSLIQRGETRETLQSLLLLLYFSLQYMLYMLYITTCRTVKSQRDRSTLQWDTQRDRAGCWLTQLSALEKRSNDTNGDGRYIGSQRRLLSKRTTTNGGPHQHSTHHPSAVVFPFLAVGPFYSTILLYTFIYINTRTFNTIQNHVIYWIEKRLFFFDKRGIIDVIKKRNNQLNDELLLTPETCRNNEK